MAQAERSAIAALIVSAENLSQAEIDCALERVDIYNTNEKQTDCPIVVAQDPALKVMACVPNKAPEASSKAPYSGTVEFYRRLGHAETSQIRDFYDVGDDKLIVVKKLF